MMVRLEKSMSPTKRTHHHGGASTEHLTVVVVAHPCSFVTAVRSVERAGLWPRLHQTAASAIDLRPGR